MDIKNALNAILPLQLRAKAAPDRTLKAGNSTDRDANGQASYEQQKKQQNHHEPMSEEQMKKALDHIKEFPAIKEHNLTVEMVEQDGKRFVYLKEPDGKILRRIHESELWTLPIMTESDPKKTGQLLRRTA